MKNGKYTDEDGTQRWYQNGQLHRDDGPAIICTNGTEYWYQNGKIHRDGAPAIIWADQVKYWYQNGKHHRDDGPALIFADGSEEWYHHGTRLYETEIQKIKRNLEADSWFREMLTS